MVTALNSAQQQQSGCVKVLTNFYSVPALVGREVQAKAYATHVEIWLEGKCIARHERCCSRQHKVLNLAMVDLTELMDRARIRSD